MGGKRKCPVRIILKEAFPNRKGLKKLPEQLASLSAKMSEADCSKPAVVFFEDEARFGRISREMFCWIKRDMFPTVARQMIREYIYAYSALSPQTGDCFSMISPCCNSEAMNFFLKDLAARYNDYRIIMILDQAGWHISKTLKLPRNLMLMHLPPYSPKLNPVELLWREIRAKHFHNRIFDSLDLVEATLGKALLGYHENPIAIKSLSKGYKTF